MDAFSQQKKIIDKISDLQELRRVAEAESVNWHRIDSAIKALFWCLENIHDVQLPTRKGTDPHIKDEVRSFFGHSGTWPEIDI